jgi:hypothetical protein
VFQLAQCCTVFIVPFLLQMFWQPCRLAKPFSLFVTGRSSCTCQFLRAAAETVS